ncbi:MAG: hypothetical protein R2864_06180 [Syntrophotaleaceae bacterium]
MQDLLIPKMTVIGTGLIGGSLSLALKAAARLGEVTRSGAAWPICNRPWI